MDNDFDANVLVTHNEKSTATQQKNAPGDFREVRVESGKVKSPKELHTGADGITGFQTLGQYLDFVKLPTAATLVFVDRFTRFQHDGTADIAQTLQKNIAFLIGEVDVNEVVHAFGI